MTMTPDMARVTPEGQVTIPRDAREALGVEAGGKVVFTSNPDGSVTVRNATVEAFDRLHEAFEGAAEEAGLKDEDDVVEMIRQMRAEKAAQSKTAAGAGTAGAR